MAKTDPTSEVTEREHPLGAPALPLGVKYRDRTTGFVGIATAAYQYLTGCTRYELTRLDNDGKPEGFVFDEVTLERVGAPTPEIDVLPGGPRPTPARPSTPTR